MNNTSNKKLSDISQFINIKSMMFRREVKIYKDNRDNIYYAKKANDVESNLNQILSSKVLTFFVGEDFAPQDMLMKVDENVYAFSKEVKNFNSFRDASFAIKHFSAMLNCNALQHISVVFLYYRYGYIPTENEIIEVGNPELLYLILALIGDNDLNNGNLGYIKQNGKAKIVKIDGDLATCFSRKLMNEVHNLQLNNNIRFDYAFHYRSDKSLRNAVDTVIEKLNNDAITLIASQVEKELLSVYKKSEIGYDDAYLRTKGFLEHRLSVMKYAKPCIVEIAEISKFSYMSNMRGNSVIFKWISDSIKKLGSLNIDGCLEILNTATKFSITSLDTFIRKQLNLSSYYNKDKLYNDLIEVFSISEILKISNELQDKMLPKIASSIINSNSLEHINEVYELEPAIRDQIINSNSRITGVKKAIVLFDDLMLKEQSYGEGID